MKKNEKLNTLGGVFNAISTDLVAPFTVIYALKLGASDFQTALLSSGPALAGLLVLIPGARWVDRQPDMKKTTSVLMVLNRAFYLAMVFVPFLWPTAQASAFILIVTLMNAPGAVANAAWQGYMARIFPSHRRAPAFASRNQAISLAGTVTSLTAGAFLGSIPGLWGYQLLFFGSFLVALAEVKTFNDLKPISAPPGPSRDAEVQVAAPAAQDQVQAVKISEAAPVLKRLKRAAREIKSNGAFVAFTLASMVFYFGWQTPWTLFSLYQVKELGANEFWVGLLAVINTSGNLIGKTFWVKLIQKKGNRYVLWLSGLPLAAVPFTYAFSHSLVAIAVLTIFIGITLAGLQVTFFNLLLEVTPEENRTTYIAYYNTTITVTAAVAPFWGVAAYQWWGFQPAFLLCGAQRILGVSALFYLWWRVRPRLAKAGGEKFLDQGEE